MEKWFLQGKKADFNQIGKRFGIDPVIARLIRNRDVIEEEEIQSYLYPKVEAMNPPYLLKDIEKAADILLEKIQTQKPVRIISDYDVDGVISNYILWTGLRRLGAKVDYEIPDRVIDGYGINESLIKQAYDDGIDTILTCDNGIAAIDQIAYAKEQGMTVIVTDHHDIPFQEEEDGTRTFLKSTADAVVNPKQKECSYPFKELCGAAVTYKLMEVLYERAGIAKEEVQEFIEYAAIATVCDVMDLKEENRIFVRVGLALLNQTKNIGLKALLERTSLTGKKLSAYHLGFVIGPCINATGRLASAKKGLSLLMAKDENEARILADELAELNEERKDMTAKGVKEALLQVESTSIKKDKVLVIYLADTHESLAGIIAGRVREKYHKPAILITRTENGLKGSGRSIDTYNMFEELTKCKDLLEKFGGHPMAAGLSLKGENLDPLRKRLNEETVLTEDDLIPKVLIDVPMPISYITKDLIKQLDLLEPFGKGNTKPLFAEKHLKLISGRILGKNQNVVKLLVQNEEGTILDALYFGAVDDFLQYLGDKYGQSQVDQLWQGRINDIFLDCTYYPDINQYNGTETMQIIIQNYK